MSAVSSAKERAAAFFEKSEQRLDNDSADLIEAVKGVLANANKQERE
jgi:hypothetical protein